MLILLVVGGLFTSTELALVSLRVGQLKAIAERGGRGRRVAKLAGEPTRYLAAVQIGSIVAGFFAAAYGSATLAHPWPGCSRAGVSRMIRRRRGRRSSSSPCSSPTWHSYSAS